MGYAALAYDLIDFMRNPPIDGFPMEEDVKCLKWKSPSAKPPVKDTVEWVKRCRRAIWIGIKLMGVDSFKELINSVGDSPILD